MLMLQPQENPSSLSLRVTFRKEDEEVLLWPSGVGNGDFKSQGTLDVAGQPVERIALVCPSGKVSSFWYHQNATQPNIQRGNMEFAFILSGSDSTCQSTIDLSGKSKHVGEVNYSPLKQGACNCPEGRYLEQDARLAG